MSKKHEHSWVVDMLSDDYETICEICQVEKGEVNE
jgi:hypothetical protein